MTYRELTMEMSGLCSPSWLANLANASALLMANLDDVNWAGFYLAVADELRLGPFQGLPACLVIPPGKGVCGRAASLRQSVRVDDVDKFPGHIVCDSRSRSELVIPLVQGSRLLGVLDVDSASLARFTDSDRVGLEVFVKELVTRTEWPDAFSI
jgi:GAF domain-containing protein